MCAMNSKSAQLVYADARQSDVEDAAKEAVQQGHVLVLYSIRQYDSQLKALLTKRTIIKGMQACDCESYFEQTHSFRYLSVFR